MHKFLTKSLATGALLASAAAAMASPVSWTMTNVITAGFIPSVLVLGSLTGSFTYDAATNVFSDILIRNTPSTIEPDALTFSSFVSGSDTSLSLINGGPDPDGFAGRHTLVLNFASALSNIGGTVSIASGTATYYAGLRTMNVLGGSVVGTPALAVPEPASLALTAIALGALFVRRPGRKV